MTLNSSAGELRRYHVERLNLTVVRRPGAVMSVVPRPHQPSTLGLPWIPSCMQRQVQSLSFEMTSLRANNEVNSRGCISEAAGKNWRYIFDEAAN